ncbi:unnamed protein product [Choristocarpus tenellus]
MRQVKVTIAFTMAVGLWHMVMRLFGVGLIATLLADPVLSGFSTASAFLIGTSQLKHLLGFDLPRASLPVIWYEAVANIGDVNLTALAIGIGGILLLWGLRTVNQRVLPKIPLPTQVSIIILTILLYSRFRLALS